EFAFLYQRELLIPRADHDVMIAIRCDAGGKNEGEKQKVGTDRRAVRFFALSRRARVRAGLAFSRPTTVLFNHHLLNLKNSSAVAVVARATSSSEIPRA